MIDRQHDLPVKRQAQLLDISRSSVYYRPRPVRPNMALMRRIDELHLELPFAGSRMLRDLLALEGTRASDITFLPMARGFVYLVAIVDWASRKLLAWRLSNTLTADFCVDDLEEALARYGKPEIFNTDQGSQFTSLAFTSVLNDHDIQISMDGKSCWRDNIFVERLWKTIKYDACHPITDTTNRCRTETQHRTSEHHL